MDDVTEHTVKIRGTIHAMDDVMGKGSVLHHSRPHRRPTGRDRQQQLSAPALSTYLDPHQLSRYVQQIRGRHPLDRRSPDEALRPPVGFPG